ncbi:DUF2871 family protein [Tuanshanicoccus lijuaniae]|uniref:DUF2871 family protein n=1 Tax=Aerococcaceae bacterium zg-1292 TaxID=2774330 RepID=UPI001BD8212F|nr:DUF2871 family protein [Aerococcaceae bacterium zg-BR9]MBF6977914.1 DUF2871 family protein [Aerococcaceae bacterium zg-BR22]MBS4455886.1 DUF2871 family protein [Aerococcaceae bacterium zg-A91]MBS4457576.1 DUF2871 family protein [Aerococcaceae bacterium zg-BR33]
MKRLVRTSTFYALLGTVAAVFYLVFTKKHQFEGTSLLSSLYLFIFALGTVFHLLLAVLEKLFKLSQHKLYNIFYWVLNCGILLSSWIMLSKGMITVTGGQRSSFLAAMTGVSHTVTFAGGALFFLIINQLMTKEN